MNTSWHKMETLHRWATFNAVGVIGFCVQLCAVYILIRVFKIEALVATALAVETAVLHNFAWHHFLTWNDRRFGKWHDFLLRLLAFNATNGMVSLAGNLFFAWLIVARRHVSPLVANLLAISVCSLVNFALSDKIVFRIAANGSNSRAMSTKMHRAVRFAPTVLGLKKT